MSRQNNISTKTNVLSLEHPIIYRMRLYRPKDLIIRHISWAPSVKDIKTQKTSKKCCIFHKKHLFNGINFSNLRCVVI